MGIGGDRLGDDGPSWGSVKNDGKTEGGVLTTGVTEMDKPSGQRK